MLASKKYIDFFKLHEKNIMFIADEAHNIVTDTRLQILDINFINKLALTATPRNNFKEDGTDKLTVSNSGVTTTASLVATTADIQAGTINYSIIGGSTPVAGTFTNLTVQDLLTVNAGTSITGDTTATTTAAWSGDLADDTTPDCNPIALVDVIIN